MSYRKKHIIHPCLGVYKISLKHTLHVHSLFGLNHNIYALHEYWRMKFVKDLHRMQDFVLVCSYVRYANLFHTDCSVRKMWVV